MPVIATIGFFDGVHRGHQCLIRQVTDEARLRGGRSLLITFDRHPRSVFAPEYAPALLTTPEAKMQLLRSTGVDDIFVLPFDHSMSELSARVFMEQVLRKQLGVDVLVVGYDHHFGRSEGLSEGYDDYKAYGQAIGIEVVAAHALSEEHVSSSAIRRALEQGDVEMATTLLGRPYSWQGNVVHGHAIGRQLGFPTANLQPVCPELLLPAQGAYAALARITPTLESTDAQPSFANEPPLKAMVNIGRRPTMDNGTDVSIEAHLLDFQGDLYGLSLTLLFKERLREERCFDGEEALRQQLLCDRDKAAAALRI